MVRATAVRATRPPCAVPIPLETAPSGHRSLSHTPPHLRSGSRSLPATSVADSPAQKPLHSGPHPASLQSQAPAAALPAPRPSVRFAASARERARPSHIVHAWIPSDSHLHPWISWPSRQPAAAAPEMPLHPWRDLPDEPAPAAMRRPLPPLQCRHPSSLATLASDSTLNQPLHSAPPSPAIHCRLPNPHHHLDRRQTIAANTAWFGR